MSCCQTAVLWTYLLVSAAAHFRWSWRFSSPSTEPLPVGHRQHRSWDVDCASTWSISCSSTKLVRSVRSSLFSGLADLRTEYDDHHRCGFVLVRCCRESVLAWTASKVSGMEHAVRTTVMNNILVSSMLATTPSKETTR